MESYAAEYEDVITTWSLPRDGRTIRNMADASSRNKAVYRTVKEAAVKVFDTITKVHSGVARHQPTGGLVRVVSKEFDSTRNSLRAGSPVQVAMARRQWASRQSHKDHIRRQRIRRGKRGDSAATVSKVLSCHCNPSSRTI